MGSKKQTSIESFKYFEQTENKNITYQNLWDAVKAVFKKKFIGLKAYISKEERSKINKPSFHFRKLEKEE